MIKWLVRKLWGCTRECKYVEVKSGRINYMDEYGADFYIMRCETCGHMKEYRF